MAQRLADHSATSVVTNTTFESFFQQRGPVKQGCDIGLRGARDQNENVASPLVSMSKP